jgi:hypothetical protein
MHREEAPCPVFLSQPGKQRPHRRCLLFLSMKIFQFFASMGCHKAAWCIPFHSRGGPIKTIVGASGAAWNAKAAAREA